MGHAEKLKDKLNYALKEANDAKLPQKEEKGQVLDFQESMDKIILKIAILKSSTRLNMQQLIEEDDEALSATNDNGKTENIEELDKLSQTLEDKIYFLQLNLLVVLDLYNKIHKVISPYRSPSEQQVDALQE